MMVVRGSTSHFIVSYDDSLASGPALADAVLAQCEADLAAMSALFGGIMPAPATLPFQINLVPGAGGASHPGCLSTVITCYIYAGSDAIGVPLVTDAEVAEVLMATQSLGFNCGASNGEALSRVVPTILYPSYRYRFSTGNAWLNSTAPSRPDWVTNAEATDGNVVSIGCGSLFLNYLAYQLNFSWVSIIAAAAPTLAETAQRLGLQHAFADFSALLARHYPPGTPAFLHDDDPFPLPDPFLYLRHNLADNGTSHTGSLASSPDIILKNNPVATPQATYSTPASVNTDTESDPAVVAGQPNYLYLRVWNHGTDATNVTATAYWSAPSTLVTPTMWNLIGTSTFADVPPGRVVQVSDPGVVWPTAGIPAPGHYCFVATVGNATDPAPTPDAFSSFDDFVTYVYAHNNLTWRNFSVVAMPGPGGPLPLPFHIAGAWDKARVFEFQTIAGLPPGSRLVLQAPRWLALAMGPSREAVQEIGDPADRKDDSDAARLVLEPHRQGRYGPLELPAKTLASCQLEVHIPADRQERPLQVAIRQLYESREVGRITWRLVPNDHGKRSQGTGSYPAEATDYNGRRGS